MDANPKNLRWISRKYLFGYFFFAVFIFLLYQLLKIFTPFVNTILVSLVLSMIFSPLNRSIRARLPASPNLAPILATAAVLVILIIPIFSLGWMLVRESRDMLAIAEKFMARLPSSENGSLSGVLPPRLDLAWNKVGEFGDRLNIDVQAVVFGNLHALGEKLAHSGGKLARNLAFFVMDFVVLLLTLFMFFRDGEKMSSRIIELAPMDMKHKRMIAQRLYETIVAVVRGVLLTAAIQGSLAAMGYAVAGVRMPIFLGIATGVAALLPFGGSALVWAPVSVYVFLSHGTGWGIFLFLWGLIMVAWLDNLFRPFLIGTQARLPIALLLLALLGGLRSYGLRGLLLGPLLVACVIAFVQIYRQEFHEPQTESELPPNPDE